MKAKQALFGVLLVGAGAFVGSQNFGGAWLVSAVLLAGGGMTFGLALPGNRRSNRGRHEN
ncbi:MAG: hypothetical protein ACYCW7_11760 [Pseudomonadaceae bacterium]